MRVAYPHKYKPQWFSLPTPPLLANGLQMGSLPSLLSPTCPVQVCPHAIHWQQTTPVAHKISLLLRSSAERFHVLTFPNAQIPPDLNNVVWLNIKSFMVVCNAPVHKFLVNCVPFFFDAECGTRTAVRAILSLTRVSGSTARGGRARTAADTGLVVGGEQTPPAAGCTTVPAKQFQSYVSRA